MLGGYAPPHPHISRPPYPRSKVAKGNGLRSYPVQNRTNAPFHRQTVSMGHKAMEPTMGFGPMTSSLPKRCATPAPRGQTNSPASVSHKDTGLFILNWWGELDSNQRSQRQQIYSLPPLTTRASPQQRRTLLFDTLYCNREPPPQKHWSRRWDSNPQPEVYKTPALPIELRRLLSSLRITFGRFFALPAAEHCQRF